MSAVLVVPFLWASIPPRRESALVEERPSPPPVSVAFYRKYTEGLLRRYVRMSMEAGKTPSLLGKEMFRGNVSNYKVESFDDVVIFLHDMDTCIGRLDMTQQELVSRIAVQDYSIDEAAALTGLARRTLIRRYAKAIDRLTRIFLEAKMLEVQKSCQGGKTYVLVANC